MRKELSGYFRVGASLARPRLLALCYDREPFQYKSLVLSNVTRYLFISTCRIEVNTILAVSITALYLEEG